VGILDEKAVMTKFGVTPEHVVDVLALTATSRIMSPESLASAKKPPSLLCGSSARKKNLLKNIHKVTPKRLATKNSRPPRRSHSLKKLVTIDTNVTGRR